VTDTLAPPELTLREVIDAVPASCRDRSTPRGLLLVSRDVAIYLASMVGLYLAESWWLIIPLWLLAGLAVSGMFVLGHDAAHGTLVNSNRLNSFLGHALFMPSLHIYEAWVLGHNRVHHGHTVRETIDFVWHPTTPEEYASMGRIQRARHRVEWSFLGAGLYYLRAVWWQKMIRFGDPPARWAARIRRDRNLMYGATALITLGVAFLGGLGSGDVAGAIWLVVKLIVVPCLLFMWSIGWTVYVHHIQPDIKWRTRKGWTKVAGQLDGTTVLRINPVIDYLFFHSIFIHMPHHVDMRIPCYHLDEAAEAIDAAFPGRVIDRRFRMRDYVAITRHCKLQDFETGEWLPYRAALDRARDASGVAAVSDRAR
jgi:omega-6 fatty acid desaturase (delta-12 desaturase)